MTLTRSAQTTTIAPRPATASPRLDTATLADIVGGLALAEDLWHPHVQHDEHERARVRLLATPAYEVWLLGWTPGQSVGLHDHGGSNGAFVVVDGALTESVVGPDGSIRTRSTVAGVGVVVPAGTVHDVANHSGVLATSIHAYSQPLRSMGYYDTAPAGTRGHRIRTLWVDDEPPVLPDVLVLNVPIDPSGAQIPGPGNTPASSTAPRSHSNRRRPVVGMLSCSTRLRSS